MEHQHLKQLEERVTLLIQRCRRLEEENQALHQQQSNLMAERANLIEKSEQARSRVEAMVARLKAMELWAVAGAPEPSNVQILEKDYLVGCPEEEKPALVAAAKYLDRRMREIRDGGKVIGTERIAVITALNIAHELLQHKESLGAYADEVDAGIRRLTDQIEAALRDRGDNQRQSE
jgi:cell division protein ZapA